MEVYCTVCEKKNNPKYKCCKYCGGNLHKIDHQSHKSDLPKSVLRKKAKEWSCSCCKAVKSIDLFPKRGNQCLECLRIKRSEQRSYRHHRKARRKCERQSTPRWLDSEQKKSLRKIYAEAQVRTVVEKEEYHVDHIVPLRNDKICGLHVPWNLRVIKATENCEKSNKIPNEINTF